MPNSTITPPSDLDAIAKNHWAEVKSACESQKTWQDSDVDVLNRYVRATMQARLMREAIGSTYLVPGSRGNEVLNPLIRMAGATEKQAHAYADALCLLPINRARLQIKQEEAATALDAILSGDNA